MTPFKWFFVSVTFIVLGVAYAASTQNSNTQTVAEVNLLADTVELGSIRSEVNKLGKIDMDPNLVLDFVNFEDVVAHLTTHLAVAQKDHPYDLQLAYVFLDENNNATKDEKQVKWILFQAKYIDEEGVVKETDERRLALNHLTD